MGLKECCRTSYNTKTNIRNICDMTQEASILKDTRSVFSYLNEQDISYFVVRKSNSPPLNYMRYKPRIDRTTINFYKAMLSLKNKPFRSYANKKKYNNYKSSQYNFYGINFESIMMQNNNHHGVVGDLIINEKNKKKNGVKKCLLNEI